MEKKIVVIYKWVFKSHVYVQPNQRKRSYEKLAINIFL